MIGLIRAITLQLYEFARHMQRLGSRLRFGQIVRRSLFGAPLIVGASIFKLIGVAGKYMKRLDDRENGHLRSGIPRERQPFSTASVDRDEPSVGIRI